MRCKVRDNFLKCEPSWKSKHFEMFVYLNFTILMLFFEVTTYKGKSELKKTQTFKKSAR